MIAQDSGRDSVRTSRGFRTVAVVVWLTASATRADKSACARRQTRTEDGPCRRTATNPHLSLTTSPCGRDVFGAVCEPSPRRRAPDDFRPEPHPPFARVTERPAACATRDKTPSDVCRARTADKPPDERYRRTARASASVRVIARWLVGHGTDIRASARFGRHTAAGFWRELHMPRRSELPRV